MHFEWDRNKAASNLTRHGVTFEEAATVFADFLSVTIADLPHTEDKARFVLMVQSSRRRLLIVAHTEHGETIRIISARPATGRERKQYDQGAGGERR